MPDDRPRSSASSGIQGLVELSSTIGDDAGVIDGKTPIRGRFCPFESPGPRRKRLRGRVVTLVFGGGAEYLEGIAETECIVKLAKHCETLLGGNSGSRVIALVMREERRTGQRPGHCNRGFRIGGGQGRLHPAAPFGKQAPPVPERPQSSAKLKRSSDFLAVHAQVSASRMLSTSASARWNHEVVARPERCRTVTDQGKTPLGMGLLKKGALPAAFSWSSANSRIVSSIEKRGAPSGSSISRTRLLSTSDARPVKRSRSIVPAAGTTSSMASTVAPPAKKSEAAKEGLLTGREEVVAPGNGVAECLLAGREIPRASREHRQPVFEMLEEQCRRKELDSGRCQFDSERQAIEAPAISQRSQRCRWLR